jgi:hypothetical protein
MKYIYTYIYTYVQCVDNRPENGSEVVIPTQQPRSTPQELYSVPLILVYVRGVVNSWSPLSLVSTIEELLDSKIIGSGLYIPEYGRGDPLR